MGTKLAELVAAEAYNLAANTKHLGTSAELMSDVESVYEAMMPLKFPKRSTTTGGPEGFSDEQLAVSSILNELMMCRMLLTKATLAAMRMYQGDSFTHVRRAVESCAFAVRMSKHHELCRTWHEAGTDNSRYKAYRDAFRTREVFPNEGHADHDPLLVVLKDRFDHCSKLIHGSVFGMANHFGTVPKGKNRAGKRHVNFFDLPPDSLVSSFLFVLNTHRLILQLFGRILEPYVRDFDRWKKEYLRVEEKLQRHTQRWTPNIMALNAARKQKLEATRSAK